MTYFNQYKALIKAMVKDTWSVSKITKKKNKKNNDAILLNEKKNPQARTIGTIVSIVIAGIVILGFVTLQSVLFTIQAISVGLQDKLLYTFIMASQFFVLFFGTFTTLNVMYFSKDNALLASLPIKSDVLFLAKFTVAYINEFLISTAIALPTITTFGIVCAINGVGYGAQFFVLEFFAIFLLPIVPLLFISLISFPLMWVISHFRRREVWNIIATALMSLVGMGIYFALIFSTSGVESGAMANSIAILIDSMSKVGIYNFLLVNAMQGVHWGLYFTLEIISILAVFGLTMLLSLMFYRKGMTIILEGSQGSSKVKKIDINKDYKQRTVNATLMMKDIKNLLKTPTLLMNSLMSLVLGPVVIIIFAKLSFRDLPFANGMNDLAIIGSSCYIAFLMAVSTNVIGMSAITIEGKNFAMLKTLPLSIKDILKAKIIVANLISFLLCAISCIILIIVTNRHDVFIGLLNFICLMLGCVGITAISIKTDLKNPNLNYKNVTELTKNNKRVLKPTLIALVIGLSYMILGFLFAFINESVMAIWLRYLIFYAVEIVINLILFFTGMRKLNDNVEEMYYSIEV